MYRILPILTDAEIAESRRIADSAQFVDGRISNPHNKAKQNEQLHEPQAYQQSSEIFRQALSRSPEFMEFAFPVALAPPMMTRYKPGMKYGAHADSAFIQSRIQDPFRRNLLFELNEVAALEGLKMDQANFGRLQVVQQNLLRYWTDKP
jgi:predicted 2-oxoglutarate/Fe(II)-dependent dioxygenase YbiX